MSCKRWQRLTALYVGGDLEDRRAQEVESHLDDCPSCRQLEQELRHDLGSLRSLDALAGDSAPPASVRGEVMQAIAERRQRRAALLSPRFVLVSAVAAVAVILAVLLAPRGIERELLEVRHSDPTPNVISEPTPIPPPPTEVEVESPPAESPLESGPLVMAHNEYPSQLAPVESRPSVPSEPMTIKILTNDPEVVIYWIVDPKGDNENA